MVWFVLLFFGIQGVVIYWLLRDIHHKSFIESIENYASRENWEIAEIKTPFREKWIAPVPIFEAKYLSSEDLPGIARFELKFWRLQSSLELVTNTRKG